MAVIKQTGDFGARLREARERRGLTLRLIADTTRISVRALEALERNDISRLPGGIFSRSFVRAYANEVGLDPEQTVADFITRFPDEIVTQGHPRTRALVDELENDSRQSRWPVLARVAVAGVPLVALLTYFGYAEKHQAPVQPVSAAAPRMHGTGAAENFTVTIHATRATDISVSPDGLAPTVFSLGAGTSHRFDAARTLLIVPTDPAAIEWSPDGLPPRGFSGPLTVTREMMLSLTGSR